MHNDAFDDRQLVDIGDEIHSQVVAHADIGHDSHVAPVKGQPLSQNATPRGFQNRGIHAGMQQDIACAAGPAAIARINAAMLNVNTIRVGHADSLAA